MTKNSYLLMQFGFIGATYVLLIVSYLLPVKYIVRSHNIGGKERILSWCNSLSAGIFVAICFLGLLPIVKEEFNHFLTMVNVKITYPIAEFTILLGFFFVLFLEQIIINYKQRTKPPVLYLDDTNEQSHHLLEEAANSEKPVSEGVGDEKTAENPTTFNLHQNSHNHHHSHIVDYHQSGLSFFALFFATGVHSIFEGLALGLIKDTREAIHLYIGIILHEMLVAFALGINSGMIKEAFRFGLIFSSTVPCGILLGIAVGSAPGAIGSLFSSVFQGIAAGTFLQVAFCELIPAELFAPSITGGQKLGKIFLIFTGFLIMALLTFVTNEC